MSVSQTLKQRRDELGYTLLDVAKKVGVSEATVQRWESGHIKNLRYDRIISLAEVLNVSPSYIMGWENELSPSQIGNLFNQLNEDGQRRVVEYASDLVASGKYACTSSSGSDIDEQENLQDEARAIMDQVNKKLCAHDI